MPQNLEAAQYTARASSIEENFIPAYGVDDNPETRFSSGFADNQWLIVDLKEPRLLHTITIYWEDAYAREYNILVSEDGLDWREVYCSRNSSGGIETVEFEPVSARYIKLDLKKRATKWGFSIWEIAFNKEPVDIGARVRASSGSAAMEADKAVDGDMSTRWSSVFEDKQWWQIDFSAPRHICGLKIYWETAYGEIYNIEVNDGKSWHRVYETDEGDGNTDIIYFKPRQVEAVRFNGIQRGTGWGFSIYEIEFIEGNKYPKMRADSSEGKHGPDLALDADKSTYWHSLPSGRQAEFEIELAETARLGGLFIYWGDDYATDYKVAVSGAAGDFQTVYATQKGNGQKDLIYFSARPLKRIRISCLESATNEGFSMREIELKSHEEQATPLKTYQAKAKDVETGLYPLWLRRLQEFWTVVGVVGDDEESLISETGTIEPYKSGFTLMPFVYYKDKLYTSQNCTYAQGLMHDILPIPWVSWQSEDWQLRIELFAAGAHNNTYAAARYRLTNNSNEPIKLKLAYAVRPVQLNPIWQRGGFSPINKAECLKSRDAGLIKINGKKRIYLLGVPDRMAAVPVSEGDVSEYLKAGSLPDSPRAQEKEGRVSAGALYDISLQPRGQKEVILIFPLHEDIALPDDALKDPAYFYEERLADNITYWLKMLSRFDIDIPQERLINVMKSNIAYILINQDGPWIKPGPRNYNHSWVRDGAMTSVALLRMGFIRPVKNWLDAVTPHITDEGYVPFIFFEGGEPVGFSSDESGEGNEYDSQGEYVFALRSYADFSGDYDYLNYAYPKAIKALRFTRKLREKRLGPEYKNDPAKRPYYGILPPSNSHEGYFPAMHSYWDDFWYLRGLKDGLYLARLMEKDEDAAWLSAEIKSFREDLYNSIKLVMERDNIDYIPAQPIRAILMPPQRPLR